MTALNGMQVSIIGAPLDLGQSRRGVDMGPSAIRYAGLDDRLAEIGCSVTDLGNVATPELEALSLHDERARYLPEILEACARLAALVESAVRAGARPLVLGGDHAVALGTLSGLAAAAGQPGGVVWIDAHGDLNTPETSPSGNVHGMPLGVCLGKGAKELVSLAGGPAAVDARHVALVGVRDLDAGERRIVKESGVRCYTMSEIDERGIATCLDESFARATTGTAGVHLSFDLDWVDPEYAPGVGTPVPGGLTYREAHLACEKAAYTGKLLGMDIVELNPILDEGNRTAKLAVELILSAFGKTIL